MKPAIEALEGRTLLAGHGFPGALLNKAEGVNDPAVQATLTLIHGDQAAIDAAHTKILSESTDTRASLKDTLKNGADLLATDRQALRDAKDDPTAFAAAKDKLKADRAQLRDDITAARTAVRDDTVDGRADLKTAMTSLTDHLKQLKTDLQNAGVIPTRPTPDASGNIAVTPEQAQTAVDKINAAAANVDGINHDAVNTLTADLTAAASDSSITPDERQKLGDDVRAVLSSVKLRDLRGIAAALRDLLPAGRPHPFRG